MLTKNWKGIRFRAVHMKYLYANIFYYISKNFPRILFQKTTNNYHFPPKTLRTFDIKNIFYSNYARKPAIRRWWRIWREDSPEKLIEIMCNHAHLLIMTVKPFRHVWITRIRISRQKSNLFVECYSLGIQINTDS